MYSERDNKIQSASRSRTSQPQFDRRFSFGPLGDGGAPVSSWPPAIQVGGGEEKVHSSGGSRPWKRSSRASVAISGSPSPS